MTSESGQPQNAKICTKIEQNRDRNLFWKTKRIVHFGKQCISLVKLAFALIMFCPSH